MIPSVSSTAFPDYLAAWSTLGLVFGTLILAIATARLVIRTRESAEEARSQARDALAQAQRQLEASYRPLLTDVDRWGPIYPDMGAHDNPNPAHRRVLGKTITVQSGGPEEEIDPRALHLREARSVAYMSLALRNVGQGMAIIAGVTTVNPAHRVADVTVRRKRVAPEETTRIDLQIALQEPRDIDARSLYKLLVSYTDFLGEQPTDIEIHIAPFDDKEGRVAKVI